MFGRMLSKIVTAPIRLASVPVKIVQRSAQAADEFMFADGGKTYRAPRKNTLDKAADAIGGAIEEAFDE